MKKKVWITCDGCSKKTKGARTYKNGMFCWVCYIKKLNPIKMPLKKYKEIAIYQVNPNFVVSFEERILLDKRLEEAFGKPTNNKTGVGRYVKALVLNDLNNWKKVR